MRIARLLLRPALCLLLALACGGLRAADDEQAPAAPAAKEGGAAPEGEDGAAEAAAPDPAVLAAAQAAAREAALEARAAALGATREMLAAGEEKFAVFREDSPGTALGTAILVPADEAAGLAAGGIRTLRAQLPELGWSTWLLDIVPPPAVSAVVLYPAPPADAGDEAGAEGEGEAKKGADAAASTPQASPAPAPPADPGKETKDGKDAAPATAPAAADAPPAPGLDEQQAAARQAWMKAQSARLASAVQAAPTDRDLLLIAEGDGTELAMAAAAALPPGRVLGIVVIEPPENSATAPGWPAKLATPVLVLLEPGSAAQGGTAMKIEAARRELRHYEQVALALEGTDAGSAESMLTRRVRSWARRLHAQQQPTAAAASGADATPSN